MYIPDINLRLSVNRNNQRRLHSLINQLFNDYSKLLVVRVDFYLKSEYEEINTHEYMNQAFTRLRNNLRFNRLFEHYITYAAKLEYGQDRKWHYHVLFFFNGQKIKNDYLLAQAIGKYWAGIVTRDLGDFYSANMNKTRYRWVGVGMIEHQDIHKRIALMGSANYLVKDNSGAQPVMCDAVGKAYRSYRQGIYRSRQTRSGRPRGPGQPLPTIHLSV